MKKGAPFLLVLAVALLYAMTPPSASPSKTITHSDTVLLNWTKFLQRLPVKSAPILDYRGKPIAHQSKAVGILPYDVGSRDLQQCADALMRLRAEYLFAQRRWQEIRFRFVSGELFQYKDYLNGWRPRAAGGRARAGESASVSATPATLRGYLDIVYAYASTLSLHRDLLPAADFAIGTVIITPGSPGHCAMIVDERKRPDGEKQYKMVESFMPAQSIYMLRNEADGSPWHRLGKGVIQTASYTFWQYALRRWE